MVAEVQEVDFCKFESLFEYIQATENRPVCLYIDDEGKIRTTRYPERVKDRSIIGLYDASASASMLRDDLRYVGAM